MNPPPCTILLRTGEGGGRADSEPVGIGPTPSRKGLRLNLTRKLKAGYHRDGSLCQCSVSVVFCICDQRLKGRPQPPPPDQCHPRFCSVPRATRRGSHKEKRRMESCIQISLSEYIDPDQSQRFDHLGRNESWRKPFPPARTCDICSVCFL